MNLSLYQRAYIPWGAEIANFFHEQGHEWKDKMLRGEATTAHPRKLEMLRKNKDRNYVDPRVSKKNARV